MKKILFMSASILVATLSNAQNAIDRYFATYKSDPTFTKVEITGKMMELAGYIEPQNDQEKQMSLAIQKIEGITVLVKENVTNSNALYKEAIKKVGISFEELMNMKEESTELKVLVKESGGVINELLVIVSDKTEFCIVDVYGEIDLHTIRDITNGMQISGMDKLQEDVLEAAAEIKMFPNPAAKGQNVSLSYNEKAAGGTVNVFDGAGKKVWSSALTGNKMEIPVSNFQSGAYTVVVEKGSASIFSQVLMVN